MTALRNDTNSLAKVRCLLSHGVDPDAPNHRGRTALAHLFDTGSGFSPAIVEALLAAGANPNGTAAGAPFLVRAVQYSRHEVVVALLDAGADPNAAFQGTVPLAMAIKDNRLGLVPPLLAAGASPEHAALVDPGFDPGALERPASGLNAPRAMGMRP
jgi:ankyrin repeat protein